MSWRNEIGHPARCYKRLMQVSVLSARGIHIGSKTSVTVFLGWHFEIVSMVLTFGERLMCSVEFETFCIALCACLCVCVCVCVYVCVCV